MKVVRCYAALDWNELDLNGSSPGARYCPPPTALRKNTITLKWNINQVAEKEKDGQSWGGRSSGREEEIRDNVLFLDQCCSDIAPDGGEWVYLLTIEYVGNGNLKMTDGQAWMKICFCLLYLSISLHLDRNCTADLSQEALRGITFISFTGPVIKMTLRRTDGHV